uniref:Oxidative stress 3 n=1 Tax=Davidia involucrata TaxID=16924 RepID=A0A5B7B9U2_DAVIN
MISLKMGSSSFNQQSNLGIMDEEATSTPVELDSISSSSSEVSSVVSLESDTAEEVTSSDSSSSGQLVEAGPLQDLSSLLQQLPFKRGLSKYFQGKSQSFTCLSNVRCLEDLAKPEKPYNKRLKSCKSYGGGLSDHSHRSCHHHILLPRRSSTTSSRLISKKASRGSFSSKRTASSFLGNNRPPIPPPPRRSTSTSCFSNQTPLFA